MQILNPFFFAPPGMIPSDLSSLVRWYKADSYSLADGDAVGGVGREWIDQSVSAVNATNAGADQPLYKTNIFGTMPGLLFSNDRLTMTSAITLAASFTIIIISKKDNALGLDSFILGHSSINHQFRIDYGGTDRISARQNGEAESISLPFTALSDVVRSQMVGKTAGSSLAHFRENKLFRDDFAFSSATAPIEYDVIGNTFFAGSEYNGYIAEICIWTALHSDADLDTLYDQYFKPRWGLP